LRDSLASVIMGSALSSNIFSPESHLSCDV
jgi:hypothetical protein